MPALGRLSWDDLRCHARLVGLYGETLIPHPPEKKSHTVELPETKSVGPYE